LLSASVIDHMIHHDKKYPSEFTCVENCIEIQSLQIASFLLTVCHVLIVSLDWFLDRNLIKFLLTAEMLKPTRSSTSHESTANLEEMSEHYPHIVFVHNRAGRDAFQCDNYNTMQETINNLMHESKLIYKGDIHLVDCELLPCLRESSSPSNVNLFLLPELTPAGHQRSILSLISDFKGHPGYEALLQELYQSIVSTPRSQLTHSPLSEKNWFHYAARMWDAVKKSQMMSEYNRLLP